MALIPTAAELAVSADRAKLAELQASASKLINSIEDRLKGGITKTQSVPVPGKPATIQTTILVTAADYESAWGSNLIEFQQLATTLAPLIR